MFDCFAIVWLFACQSVACQIILSHNPIQDNREGGQKFEKKLIVSGVRIQDKEN